jgi:hypothetical protein
MQGISPTQAALLILFINMFAIMLRYPERLVQRPDKSQDEPTSVKESHNPAATATKTQM